MKNRLKFFAPVVLASLLVGLPAHAQQGEAFSFHNAGQVKAVCEDTAPDAVKVCGSQLQGAFDMAEIVQVYNNANSKSPLLFCPDFSKMGVDQLKQNYLLMANALPTQMEQPFSAIFLGMLMKAYPCK